MNNENDDINPQGHGLEDADNSADDNVSLDTGRPAVAAAPAKVMIFIIIGLLCIGIVVKSLFFSDAAPPAVNKVRKTKETVMPGGKGSTIDLAAGGDLPTPPQQEPISTYKSESPTGAGDSSLGKAPDLGKLPPPPSQGGGNLTLGASPIAMQPPPDTASGKVEIVAPNMQGTNIAVPPPPLLGTTIIPPPAGGIGAVANPAVPKGAPAEIGSTPPLTEAGGLGGKAPPPPPPSNFTTPPLPTVKTSLPKDEKALKRIQADSSVFSGGAAAKQDTKAVKTSTGFVGNTDSNSQFANAVTAASHDEHATAERISNLEYTLIQGKIINSVLETAIDSTLPGTLRAVVSHDVYAEAGRAILIPKGSRLIGTYNTGVKRGQGRVMIIWTRVIRPDGVTIDVDSPAVDNLGRAGLLGDVDNHYTEMFSTALLTSSFDIGLAAIGQALFGSDQQTTTNNGSGGTTTTSSSTATAMQQAVADIGNVGKQIVSAVTGLGPTITVDQGTPVNIFVNKELVFPPSVTRSMSFVQ